MKFISACYLLPLFPVLVFSTRHGYEELERQLKDVFKERSNILRQLSKTSKELERIKVNLQSLKNDEASAKSDVQKLLELGQKQREEMKSLQEAFQKQLNEAAEKAEKQQATINFLKSEMERKSKMIRDLQNEAQQLTDLEQKLAIAKDKLEKAALDKESQLKALKETVQLCLSSVLHNQPPATNIISSKPTEKLTSQVTNGSKFPFQVTNTKLSSRKREILSFKNSVLCNGIYCVKQEDSYRTIGISSLHNSTITPHRSDSKMPQQIRRPFMLPQQRKQIKVSRSANHKMLARLVWGSTIIQHLLTSRWQKQILAFRSCTALHGFNLKLKNQQRQMRRSMKSQIKQKNKHCKHY
ncbi:leucine zipper protein 2 isoform X3 [Caretta caretta]|uniref:leucine zipper protein 2 isoform X3 n=1 Tax=Caretta caretta TaxID=8467 RepID=UPI002094A539|nr:leucine zipper protein 2 isoform X4 [Caretta caretta]